MFFCSKAILLSVARFLPKSSQKSSQPALKIAQFFLRESNQPIPKVAQIIVNKMEKQHIAIFH